MDQNFGTHLKTTGPQRRWYAVHVKSRSEKVVAAIAQNKGFEEFLPLCKVRRRWSDRLQTLDVPLFPGYLFCRIGAESRLPILTIPGVLGFAGVGKTPLPIEDDEIAAIQTAVGSGLLAEPWPFLNSGEVVRLEAGPLAGLEGIYVTSRKQHRIVVSVALLQRSMAIEIDRDWVTPLKSNAFQPVFQLTPASH